MKKYLLFVLFGFIILPVMAQDRIVLLRDTTRLGISMAALEKSYPPAFARVAGEQGLFARQGRMFLDTINTRQQQFFTFIEKNKKRLPVLGIMIQTQEFIRPDGIYDRVFCEFSGRELTDEQEVQLLQLVAEWYGQHPFPIKTKTGFRWSSMTTLGSVPQKRTVRRGSGIISTLEAAEQTTRPDTVTMLAFNQLELKAVPEIVYRFPKLEELDLSKNNLHELPARLTADIPTLKRLSALYNSIPDDSVFITRNKHLLSLNLQGNKLTRIPASVRQNRRLESLWMGNNKLSDIDIKALRRLRRLTDLNLYNAGLSQLPKTMGRLKHVKVLDLYYNKLTELPRQLGRMKRLEQLAVAHNDLKEMPVSLAKLRRLQVLFAHHNRISQLPSEFQRLQHLRVLDLGYNWITVAPNVLGSIPNLEELDLNNNNLQEFPTVLLSIKGLKKVYMGSNPLFGREAMTSPYASQIKQLEANNTQVTY
ncbi:leucine-rich repeat domain-containing protein [Spirosoma sp. HMF4905]|uniref:Leucine-rich repeat domain-containing protein n=1 Tax=Spirosoma arboris TaxID=2682092 RepID=A0A7K1SLZ9_9BACT|nr:leucine-rich repeat domain-containing protein [Spirosoma arboris]MVM34829.1 leucine-rich repeat domain-containing protein [Spirosoma arboris]